MDQFDVQREMGKRIESVFRSGKEFGELSLDRRDNIAVYFKGDDPMMLPPPFTTLPKKWLDHKDVEENGLLLAFFRWANLLGSDALPCGFIDALRSSVDKQNMYLGLTLAGAWRTLSAMNSNRNLVAETRKYSNVVPNDVPEVTKRIMNRFKGIQNITLDINDGVFVTKILLWDELYPAQENWPDWFSRSLGKWNDLPFVSKADPRTETMSC